MSRKSNTEQRRDEITAALLACIAAQGYEKATIQSIAREASLAPGLIHYHFKSKDEILLRLVSTLGDVARDRFTSLAAAANTPDERLGAYIDARLALGKGANPNVVAAWVIIGAEAVRQDEVRAAYQKVVAAEIALASTLIGDCLEARGRASKSAGTIAAALVTFVEGAFQLASAAREVMPKGYAADAARTMCEAMMSTVAAAAPKRSKR